MNHDDWMRLAIEQARRGMAGGGSPFGASIVNDGRLVATSHNHVWQTTDPTAHAETHTIRLAARELKTIDLTGCVMYTTCEPCPMCASAIHWSKIDAVYYGATIADAQRAGFSELVVPAADLYRAGGSRVRITPGVLSRECAALFDEWLARADHRSY